MSLAAATARFARQSARSLRALHATTVQPYRAADLTRRDGAPVSVALSAAVETREIGDTGFVTVCLAELRVLKGGRWAPAAGIEFVDTGTGHRYRIRTAAGAESPFAREIVCEVVRIAP